MFTGPPARSLRELLPLVAVSASVALVTFGVARGFWVSNVHNAMLGVGFTFVGAWVLYHRANHREGWLFTLIGVVESVMFLGRQIGHFSTDPSDSWWGWLGVWPLPLSVALVTLALIGFPEGRPLTRAWRAVGAAVIAVGGALSLVSALWPVAEATNGVMTPHPFSLFASPGVAAVYTPVADGAFIGFQALWIVAIAVRWRDANSAMRRQLRVLLVAVAAALVLLLVGLLVWGSPLAGLLSVGLVPIAAGYAIDGISLAKTVETKRVAGQLTVLTPRELEVLDLMAQGLSNQAICGRLHLSIKTVEPLIGSIFLKLDLPTDGNANKRVQAVVRYLGR